MKELSIEEKAKRYDEAIERAKNTIEVNQVIPDIVECVESLFPELCESEDERIRKELIKAFKEFLKQNDYHKDTNFKGVNIKEAIAWLEKQGKKEPMTDSFEKELAEICNQLLNEIDAEWMDNEIFECLGTSQWLKLCDDTAKRYKDGLLQLVKQVEQNPSWSDKDENAITWIKCICNDFVKSYKISPASTKVVQERVDKIENWLKSLKDRVQPQSKQDWSEEDETALGDALWCCKQAASIAKDENDMGNVWYAEHWLKSLRPQNTWKPSDEQIKALKDMIEVCEKQFGHNEDGGRDLLEQLKRL